MSSSSRDFTWKKVRDLGQHVQVKVTNGWWVENRKHFSTSGLDISVPLVWTFQYLWSGHFSTSGLDISAPLVWTFQHLWSGHFSTSGLDISAPLVWTFQCLWSGHFFTSGLDISVPLVWTFQHLWSGRSNYVEILYRDIMSYYVYWHDISPFTLTPGVILPPPHPASNSPTPPSSISS
ncbi:hypothetical protein Btru_041212 [Bulinus truncatus]|nr:hypothetical protein Btru_041212 [Bulinus truncatus]